MPSSSASSLLYLRRDDSCHRHQVLMVMCRCSNLYMKGYAQQRADQGLGWITILGSKGRCAPGTNALSFSASARHVYDYLAANASTVQYEYRTSNRRAPYRYEYCSRILLRTGFQKQRGVTSSISPVTSSCASYCFGMYSCNYNFYLYISTT